LSVDADFAQFIQIMLDRASTAYQDPGFPKRLVNAQNRLDAFKHTDLFIQTTLAPNSRFQSDGGGSLFSPEPLRISYLGPSDGSGSIFATPIAAQYAVKPNGASFVYAVEESSLPLVARVMIGKTFISTTIYPTPAFTHRGCHPENQRLFQSLSAVEQPQPPKQLLCLQEFWLAFRVCFLPI